MMRSLSTRLNCRMRPFAVTRPPLPENIPFLLDDSGRMAAVADNGANGTDRLDSWKAIASYLNRGERTVRRWERDNGLPVHRVPGKRGNSVFAYRAEIDVWLRTPHEGVGADLSAPEQPVPARRRAAAAAIAGILVAGAVLTAVWWTANAANDLPARVDLTASAVVAFGEDGAERWRHDFVPERIEVPEDRMRNPVDLLPGTPPALLTATSLQILPTEEVRGGQVLLFNPAGRILRTLSFDDEVRFGTTATAYGQPWGITDFRVEAGDRSSRIAVAMHHYQWWPSIIAILDERLQRRGTFVNAGWLERVHWLSPDRLLVSGFSESRNGGVVALLDPAALNGQGPEDPAGTFFCGACGADRPLRYVVMPRSEVNLATRSRFNRGRLQIMGDRIIVRTIEVPFGESDAIDAVYEYSSTLDFVRASFSDRYWEAHRALEAEGKLDHARERCPERDGPREILTWEPQAGWRTIKATG